MRIGLRFKWVAVVVFLILFVSTAICVVTIRRGTATIREQLNERCVTLTRGMAHNSEYGLFTRNKEVLTSLVRSIMEAPDVSYCAVYDKAGGLLAGDGDIDEGTLKIDIDTSSRFIKRSGPKKGGVLDIVVPVVSKRVTPGSSETSLFPDEEGGSGEAGEELALFQEERVSSKELMGFARVGISEARGLRNIRGLTNDILKVSGLVMILAIMITILCVNRLIKPIQQLSAATQRFAEGGLLPKVNVSRNDEIGILAGSFNKMMNDLRQTTTSIDNLNREIISRQETEKELRKTHDKLKASNTELESFSYSVSHDLRTPLRSMDGFSQILLEDYGEQVDQTGQDYLRRIRAASQNMGELIGDMLQLSRITRAELTREEVDLSGLATEIAGRLSENDREREVDFVIEPGITAHGDKRLLGIALENLLGNAHKFTSKEPDSRIEFGTCTTCKAAYYVRDNGVGFDTEYADKAFGAFQRLHTTKEFPGTGVGLATVKRVISKHGGRIWVEAQVGEGATFYFTLG